MRCDGPLTVDARRAVHRAPASSRLTDSRFSVDDSCAMLLVGSFTRYDRYTTVSTDQRVTCQSATDHVTLSSGNDAIRLCTSQRKNDILQLTARASYAAAGV